MLLLPVYDQSLIAPCLWLAERMLVAAVLNPNNGPGAFDKSFAKLKSGFNGMTTYGYIDMVTKNGKGVAKSPSQLDQEERRWKDYGVNGFFFDDLQDTDGCKKGLQSRSGTFIANPGTKAAGWMREHGTLCEFEGVPGSSPKKLREWRACRSSVRVAFVKGPEEARIRVQEARSTGCNFLALEDAELYHKGEYQQPVDWWRKLPNIFQS